MTQVAQELGILAPSTELDEAAGELATVGREEADHAGTPLFFRTPEQKPMAMRSAEQNGAPAEAPVLQSQHILVAGMLRPAHLLDLMRNFSVFQQVDGKTRKVVARYQQFRAVHKAVLRLQEGRTREWSSPR
jgi:type I restriction enzyme R subunit